MHQQQTAFENVVGKGEIAHSEQFLLFPPCFLLSQVIVSPFVHIFNIIYLYLLLIWKSLKLACVVVLMLYYTIQILNDPGKESFPEHCEKKGQYW